MINKSFSYDRKKTDRLGKLFSSIDFTVKENYTADNYRNNKKAIAGKLHIGNSEYEVNVNELNRIAETVHNALEVLHKKYRTGLMR